MFSNCLCSEITPFFVKQQAERSFCVWICEFVTCPVPWLMVSTFWQGNDFPKHNIMNMRSMSRELTFWMFFSNVTQRGDIQTKWLFEILKVLDMRTASQWLMGPTDVAKSSFHLPHRHPSFTYYTYGMMALLIARMFCCCMGKCSVRSVWSPASGCFFCFF